MVLEKKDFIEIEFTGRVKEGDIFDSNIKKDLEKSDLDFEPKPFIFSLGEGMFLKGIEDFLIGKEVDKYKIELTPEKAFGDRNRELIKIVSTEIFRKQNLKPVPGIMFNFDGRIAKVLSVSGGRVTVDFNNPVAGKTVVYDLKVLRKIEDINEKAKAFIDFLFRRDLKFKIDGKKLVLEVEKNILKFAEAFKKKFEEVLDLELIVKEVEEKVNDKTDNSKEKSQ